MIRFLLFSLLDKRGCMSVVWDALQKSEYGVLVDGDQINILKSIPNGSVDFVYLDPPWGTGNDFQYSEGLNKDYKSLLAELLSEAARVLNDNGNLVVHYPEMHDVVAFSFILRQLFGDRDPFRITTKKQSAFNTKQPSLDKEIFFWSRKTDDSFYCPTIKSENLVEETLFVRKNDNINNLFSFKGIIPPENMMWRYSEPMLQQKDQERLILEKNGKLRLKRFQTLRHSLSWDDLFAFRKMTENQAFVQRLLETFTQPEDIVVLLPYKASDVFCSVAVELERKIIAKTFSQLSSDLNWSQYERISSSPIFEAKSKLMVLSTEEIEELEHRLIEQGQVISQLKWKTDNFRIMAKLLWEAKIPSVPNFQGVSTSPIIDCFIPTAPGAVIEIKENLLNASSIFNQMKSIKGIYGETTECYLVVVGDGIENNDSIPDYLTLISGKTIEECVSQLIEDFRMKMHQYQDFSNFDVMFATFLPTLDDEWKGSLGTMALMLESLFEKQERNVFNHEMKELFIELRAEHFTAAGLRVGRTLEHVVYSACNSWGVTVRKPVLQGLKKIEDVFTELNGLVLKYILLDEEEKKEKRKLKQMVKKKGLSIQNQIIEFLMEIDEQSAKEEEADVPKNIGAMLGDIRKKYARIKTVRDSIDLLNGELVHPLLKFRNDAAHAALDGNPREIEKKQVLEMVSLLNQILNELAKCGKAIILYQT